MFESLLGRYAIVKVPDHCATLAQSKSGIAMSELPKTIQDAILVTRKLHQRYIWVDSICIVQDDMKDWEVEASKMKEVYSHALCTISAVRSRDDVDGFLNLRQERQYVPLTYSINGVSGSVLVFPVPIFFAADADEYFQFWAEPLTKRAWALQERYLSQRLIHFGSTQTSFECKSQFLTEDGYASGKLDFLGEDTPSREAEQHRGYQSWANIIHEYSRRELSEPSDKLPALAGLASRFRGHFTTGDDNQQYLAGLWRRNLVEDLCWQVIGGRATRAPSYRAPSWSWLSLDGSVGPRGIMNHTDLVYIEAAHVETFRDDPFGKVTAAWIQMKASVLPVLARSESDQGNQNDHLLRTKYFVLEGDEVNRIVLLFDVKEERDKQEMSEERALYAMPLVRKDAKILGETTYVESIIGLVLQAHERDGAHERGRAYERDRTRIFERIGMFIITRSERIAQILARRNAESLRSITLV